MPSKIVGWRANCVQNINVIRGKDRLCIFAFMQVGHEIRSPAGRYVLQKTFIHNSLSAKYTFPAHSILDVFCCANISKHGIREAGIGRQIVDLALNKLANAANNLFLLRMRPTR